MAELLRIEEPTPRPRARPQWRAFLELGFRPLYPLAVGWAALSVLLWVFAPQWLVGALPGLFWHAHEMLWGFVATIAVGFLLTAGATWTGINPLHGPALAAVVALWLLARLGFVLPGAAAFSLAVVCELLFFLVAAIAMARVVHRARSVRNYGVAPLLLGLGISDAAFLWACWQGDFAWAMRFVYVGMLCMALVAVLVARRVIPFFASRAIAGLQIPMLVQSGRWQLLIGSLAIAAVLLQWPRAAAVALVLVGATVLWQTLRWQPWCVRAVPLLWILYLGYAGLGLGLLSAAAHLLGWIDATAWPMHVIGLAGFSVLVIGMVTRTALGHLGRPLRTDRSMLLSYLLMLLSVAARLLALAALPPAWSVAALHTSATAWALAWALYLWRFVPMLIRPRADQPGGQPVPLPLRPAVAAAAQAKGRL